MKIFAVLTLVSFSALATNVFAANWSTVDANAALVQAIGFCQPPNNPYENALKPLGGNQFAVHTALADDQRDTIVVADVLENLGGAIALKGRLWLTMDTPRDIANALPVCSLSVTPIP